MPDDVLAAFERSSGLTVTFVAPGDAGTLVNQLILTKDAPLGDVVYGIDNTFASRAIDEGIFADYASAAPAAADAAGYAIPGSDALTAIDYSDVCINVDHRYFASRGLAEPVTLDDLTNPAYRGLLSVTNPATSSPGLAFLLATVAAYGDALARLLGEAARQRRSRRRVVDGRLLLGLLRALVGRRVPARPQLRVVAAVRGGRRRRRSHGRAARHVLPPGGVRGRARGREEPRRRRQAVIDWMLSDAFQAALPENMYVYPVSASVAVPPDVGRRTHRSAPTPTPSTPRPSPRTGTTYIRTWTSVVIG